MPDDFERAAQSIEAAEEEMTKAQEAIQAVLSLLRFTDFEEDVRDVAASLDTVADDMAEIRELIRKGA